MSDKNSAQTDSSVESQDSSATPSLAPTCDFAEDSVATRLVGILDGYLEDLKAGRAVSQEQLLAAHPDLAERLKSCLAGIEFLHQTSEQETGGEPFGSKQLGDFRLGREVGRGGMGAVYEAVQVSLGRRVALKILRFGSISDPEAVDRFRREAETVANLHHTNIVPIFSVGSERGINYYAMQFIEGKSLDQVLREADHPLDQHEVARWGLQAAEALAHAHQRHVIHRDVKPSNLILDDAEGRLWLTDFGLAKRLDDVTLSMTGALLGTPRYMSPEQADATHRTIDHRTDLYSLGATLYELLSGQPVFEGQNPHRVLHQIIADQPRPLRNLRPSLERDLDTIVTKCLAKEPSQRYASAKALSDDLRAFLDGRPIRARRPGIVDMMIKTLKRRKQSVALSVGTFVAAMIFFAALLVSFFGYQRSQLARLSLQTDTPPLIADIIDREGSPVTASQTLPTQQPLEIPSGELQVRVSGRGQVSQTYRTTLPAGQSREFDVDLTDSRIGSTIPFSRALQLIRTPSDGASGSITVGRSQLAPSRSRLSAVLLDRDGISLKTVAAESTTRSLRLPNEGDSDSQRPEGIGELVGFRWWTEYSPLSPQSGWDKFDLRPFVVGQLDSGIDGNQLAPDLDGDSIPDLLIAARHQAWLLALSGKDLSTLWFAARGADLVTRHGQPQVVSACLDIPQDASDLDGDGVIDLLCLFADATQPQNPRRWIEAISGRDGTTIWETECAPEWFQLPAGRETPYAFRWFVGGNQGYSSGGGGGWSNFNGIVTRSRQYEHARSGSFVAIPDRLHLSGTHIHCLAGNHLLKIDAASGNLLENASQNIVATRPAIWADVDGDGGSDAVLVEYRGKLSAVAGYPPVPARVPRTRLAAWSPKKGKLLWQLDVTAREPQRLDWTIDPPEWPIVVDLNDDGVSEVIVPNGTSDESQQPRTLPWGGVDVIDGKTGTTLWSRRIPTLDQWIEFITAGPDVDQDGYREMFVANLWSDQYTLFVDCCSGANGELLWQSRHDLRSDLSDSTEYFVTGIDWCGDPDSGVTFGSAPALMVTTSGLNERTASTTHLLDSATGKMLRSIRQHDRVLASDADGDGLEDIAIIYGRPEYVGRDGGGELAVFQSPAFELWRRLADASVTVADHDGDQIRDLLVNVGGILELFSGATGDLVWRNSEIANEPDFLLATDGTADSVVPPADFGHCPGEISAADLNQDDVIDLVMCKRKARGSSLRPLRAFSGDTGEPLWTAELEIQNLAAVLALETRDLDGDSEHEVLLLAAMDLGYPERWSYSSSEAQLWMLVFSGRTGRLKWKQPLSPAYGNGAGNSPYRLDQVTSKLCYGDTDHDGVLDVLVPAANDGGTGITIRMLSGVDGNSLWSAELPLPRDSNQAFALLPPGKLADLNGDDRLEVVQPSMTAGPTPATSLFHVQVFDGLTGELRWQWQVPVDIDCEHLNVWPQDWLLRPGIVLPRRGDGTRAIAMVLFQADRSIALSALDNAGNLIGEFELGPPRSMWMDFRQRVLVTDVDGDDGDELIVRRPNEMIAVRVSDQLERVWTRTDLAAGMHVWGRLPAPDTSESETLLVAGGANHRVLGIDASTGETIWQCAGPTPAPHGTTLPLDSITLLSRAASFSPLVAFAYNDVIVCRHGTPTAYRPVRSSDRVLISPELTAMSGWRDLTAHDPRLIRPLPWASRSIDVPEVAEELAWMVFYCLTLLVLPLGYLGYLTQRRSFGLRPLMLAPVIVAIALMGVTVSDAGASNPTLTGKLAMAAFVLGPLVAIGTLTYWAIRRRWRAVLSWLLLSIVAAAILFAIMMQAAEVNLGSASLPESRQSYRGWYWVWFPGAIATSWALVFVITLQGIIARIKNWRSRNSRPQATAGGIG